MHRFRVEGGVLRVQVNGDNEAAAWLFDILLADDDAPAPAEPATPGADEIPDHAVLPPRGRGRFLVPVEPSIAAASISTFNGLRRWPTRVVRASLAGALRLGGARALLGTRVEVDSGDGSSELADRWLVEHLRQVLGERRIVMASGLRPGDTFAKPVLQLFRPDGTPVGFAKVGWNDVTVPRVRAEAALLAAWDTDAAPTLRVPRLLHAGSWAGRYVSVTAPMPARARRLRRTDAHPALSSAAVHGSAPTTREVLGDSGHWRQLVADAHRLASTTSRSAAAVGRLVDHLGEQHLGVALRFGRWHGDWVSWNLALADGTLWAWDWEYSDPCVPVGLDLVHHVFQEEFVGKGRAMVDAMAAAERDAHRLLPVLGLSTPEIDATVVLHRVEVLRRDALAEATGAPADQRLEPDHVGVGVGVGSP